MTTNAPRSTQTIDAERQAQARLDAGLGPPRETAPAAIVRPPDAGSHGAQWLLVTCVGVLAFAVVLLLVASIFSPNSTLAGLFGTRLSVQAAITPPAITLPALEVKPALPGYLASLPGYRLWLSDDFAAPGPLTDAAGGEAGSQAGVVLVDRGVYRMQVTPQQLNWTLFDLAQTDSYRLETSATVDAAFPGGAAGVLARFNGPGNFYLFTIDGAGAANVQLWQEGTPYSIPAASITANAAGQANRLAITDDGQQLRFYANQVQVAEVPAPQLPYGRPGLAVVAPGDEEAAVDFDWLSIYQAE